MSDECLSVNTNITEWYEKGLGRDEKNPAVLTSHPNLF